MSLFQLYRSAIGNDLGGTLHNCRRTKPDIDDGISTHGVGFVYHPLGGDLTGLHQHFCIAGDFTGYTEMLVEARQIATKRMVDEANAMGADAIVNIRFGSSAVMQGAAEVIAYGTAVKLK